MKIQKIKKQKIVKRERKEKRRTTWATGGKFMRFIVPAREMG